MGSMLSDIDVSLGTNETDDVSGSENSSDTEPYDLADIEMDLNRNTDVIDVDNGLPNARFTANRADDDEDCVLIAQPVETIDLCQLTPRVFRFPVRSDEVIEIVDSPVIESSNNQPFSGPSASSTLLGSTPKKPRLNLNDSMESGQRGTLVSCPICLESILGRNPVSTNCGHMFCEDCIKASLRIGKKCPMCKKNLPGRTPFHKIFF
jgi:Zinc finger, C3HC4 type (RING finger)